ncbi:iron ABC transporter substrate-binding protein [Bordetella sp. FB-8]|uniref:iron ABC transporter substrate-binding protein n=1 Tax=Bordetella sp. FB-8 TaxID=1159870 RepID=UPI00037F60B5|nr:iron ABC transporter substrate-binding protein [Bordetella sp. FB-8]
MTQHFMVGRWMARTLRAATFGALVAGATFASPGAAWAASAPLTLYSAQHGQLVKLLVADFQKMTDAKVQVHSGEGPEVAAQLLAEGVHSPADVYFTENSPELTLLEEKGLLARLDASTLKQVPARYSSPQGEWVGVVARENVLAYNPSMMQASQLPASLMDLAKPEWKDRVAIAPADGDFLPLVSALVAIKGHDQTLNWLKGLKANAKIYDDDEGVVAAVNSGAVATGVVNNYYWARLHAEMGDKGTHSAIYHFGNGDVGALVNVSGAAVLKTAHDRALAQKFVAYLVSKRAQELMAKSKIDFEYPLHAGVAPDPLLKPFKQLQPPALTMQQLGDDSQAGDLLREAGLL